MFTLASAPLAGDVREFGRDATAIRIKRRFAAPAQAVAK
jgi:hypothetical protein